MQRRAPTISSSNNTSLSIPLGSEVTSKGDGDTHHPHTTLRNNRSKKLRRKKKNSLRDGIFLIILLIATSLLIFGIAFSVVYAIVRLINPKLSFEIKGLDHTLYQKIYDAAHKKPDYYGEEPEEESVIERSIGIDKRISSYSDSYHENIMEKKCSITILFIDPRTPMLGDGSSTWFSLESVAAFLPEACVSIQTSSCLLKEKEREDASSHVFNYIYNKSLPLFRKMMENGQVRISFLDHTKYKLDSCSDWSKSISRLFMNIHFWKDEFIDNVDSDSVLVIQDDTIICHSFDLNYLKEYAFVGAVWPQKSNKLFPYPPEGMCVGMPIRWDVWTLQQRRWEHGFSRKPKILLDLKFPTICKDGVAPLGNGGFSLRSRKWMIAAITSCPSRKYSGFDDLDGTTIHSIDEKHGCSVTEEINEDFYFGTILRGIHAPLPTAYEASLFSVEMVWPEDAIEMYGGPTSLSEQQSIASKLWGKNHQSFAIHGGISFTDKTYTVPVGMHKPWWYHPNRLLLGNDITEQCPMLRYLFDPEESKWEENFEGNTTS